VAAHDPPVDEFPIEQIGAVHGIAAEEFVPFVIRRLSRSVDDRARDLDVELVDIGGVMRAVRRMRVTWQAASGLERPPGVQDHVVTEWAALGIAMAVVWQYAGLRAVAVAEHGDRFDYWVSDGHQRFGLEVSGTITPDLTARHSAKARQLLDNPLSADGYVVVVGFADDRVIVSFHQVPRASV
jgi:hypothetical protein